MTTRDAANLSSHTPGPRWPSWLARSATGLAILAVLLLVTAGPGYRLGVLPLLPALLAAAAGFLLFVPVCILSGIAVLARRRGSQPMPRGSGVLVVLSGIVTIVTIVWIARVRSAPPVHDITTDLQNPPAFHAIVPLRAAAQAVNPPEYQRIQSVGGNEIDVSEAQRRAYPQIRPLELDQDPVQVLHWAEQAARNQGWQIVAIAPAEGRIEATDTTAYFGFEDDIVVRVQAAPSGTRVDVRSKSRVGVGDAGTNARRIAAYVSGVRELARAARD